MPAPLPGLVRPGLLPPGPAPRIGDAIETALFAVAGLTFMAVALPLWRRRVPPNAWYGVRLRATFADPTVWYDANARAGRELFWFGLAFALFALGVGLAAPRGTGLARPLACVAVLAAGTLAVAVRSWRYAERALRERSAARPAGPPPFTPNLQ